MGGINKYGYKDFRDPIAEDDTLIGSSSFTRKTKNFILKDLIAFIKTDLVKSTTPRISTYDVAVKNGFIGTEAEWLNSFLADINTKVNKVEGKNLLSDLEIARLGTLNNYDDTALILSLTKKIEANSKESLLIYQSAINTYNQNNTVNLIHNTWL